MTANPLPPNILMASAVPADEANMIKVFSVSNIVEKNFSCLDINLFRIRADLLPCSSKYLVLNLLTDIIAASALVKMATMPMLRSMRTICNTKFSEPMSTEEPEAFIITNNTITIHL